MTNFFQFKDQRDNENSEDVKHKAKLKITAMEDYYDAPTFEVTEEHAKQYILKCQKRSGINLRSKDKLIGACACNVCYLQRQQRLQCIQCDVVLCNECLEKLQNKICPACRSNKGFKKLDRLIQNYIDELKLQCPFDDKQFKGNQKLWEHIDKDCKCYECPLKCNAKLSYPQLLEHFQICPNMIETCEDCEIEYQRGQNKNPLQHAYHCLTSANYQLKKALIENEYLRCQIEGEVFIPLTPL